MKHINEIHKEEWFKRPWVLLGTGPTLDNFKADDWIDYNIAAIYDAYYACKKVDLMFVSDAWGMDLYPERYWENDNIRYVATRSINAPNIGFQKNVIFWDYDCDQKEYGVRLFNNVQQYPCSNTSSFAILFFGKMGIREVRTFGIDGGKGVSNYVSDKYRKLNDIDYDFSHENDGLYGHAASYYVKLIKM